MIIREKRWLIILSLWTTMIQISTSQEDRSYDTNDWIPITPSDSVETTKEDAVEAPQQKKATARVLNIESPNQRFFPDNEYDYRKGRPQGNLYLREGSFKTGPRPQKPLRVKPDYKYELPLLPPPSPNQIRPVMYPPQQVIDMPPPPPPPRYVDQRPVQAVTQTPYFTQKLPPMPNVNPQVPEPNAPSLYEQYNIPFNQSFYQSLNPTRINQELLTVPQNSPQTIQSQVYQQQQQPSQAESQKENSQLFYVPLEDLKSHQPTAQDSQTNYKQINSPTFQEKHYYQATPEKQQLLDNIQQDFNTQALQSYKLQEQIQLGQPIHLETTSTTPKPKKRKPHQPPLSVFMQGSQRSDVTDVLEVLSDAKSIAVQDTIEPHSPKIFIGPSNLNPTNDYVKFPLPYLNSLDGETIQRKIENLPFFVAPLSYKTPPGYSKIRLPSPHVGSVVVSNKEELHGKTVTQKPPQYNRPSEIGINKYVDSPAQPTYNSELSREQTPVLGNPGNSVTADLINRSNEIIRNSEKISANRANFYTPSPIIETSQLSHKLQQENNKQELHALYPNDILTNKQNYEHQEVNNPNSQSKTYTFLEKDAGYQQQFDLSQLSYKLPSTDVNSITSPREKSTSAPRRPEQTAYKPTQSYESLTSSNAESPDINPLELAINEYELHQINSELEPNKKLVKHSNPVRYRPETDKRVVSSTPTSVVSKDYEQQRSTPRSDRVQQRRRGRPTRPTTPKPTETGSSDRYTVLEEFNIKQPSTTEKYVPTEDVSKFNSYQEEDQYKQGFTEIEQIPSSVYKLNTKERENAQSGFRSTIAESYNEPLADQDNYRPAQQTNQQQLAQDIYRGRPTPQSTDEPGSQDHYSVRPTPQGITQTREPTINTQYLQPSDISQLYQEDTYNTKSAPSTFTETYPQNTKSAPPTFTETYQQNNQEIRQQTVQQGLFETTASETPNFRPEIGLDTYSGQYQTENISPTTNTYQDADENYLNLQDQAIRSLLIPRYLVPTTKQQETTIKAEVNPPTKVTEETSSYSLATEEPHIETTTRAQRTRGRHRVTNSNRQQTSSSTTSSSPRRAPGRRRPAQRTTTQRATSTDYASREDAETRRTAAANKQRFRTKSRPLQEETVFIDRVSTTENDINLFKEPVLEGGFEAASSKPSSYMQFDNNDEELEIITLKPNQIDDSAARDYHQVYNLPQAPTTENSRIAIQYENTGSNLHKPVVDVQITHPIPSPTKEVELDIITTADQDDQYVRYNSNIQSGGVLRNNKIKDDVPKTTQRTRTRTRGRSRFGSSSTPSSAEITISSTTRRPIVSSTTQRQLTKQEREEEFFGFIRQPNFGLPAIQGESVKKQPSQEYLQRQVPVNAEPEADTSSVRFVGEIRPKYRVSTQRTVTEADTESLRARKRGRIRVPSKKINKEPSNRGTSDNDVITNAEPITRRTNDIRTRSRGTSHFRVPDNLKKSSGDDDVEGGNYPAPFLEKRELITPKPTAFQITVEPSSGHSEDEDQSPHSSIVNAQILPKPENWSDSSILFSPNQITDDISKVQKKEFSAEKTKSIFEIDESINTENFQDKDDIDQINSDNNTQTEHESVGSAERLTATSTDKSDISEEIFRHITEAAETISSNLEKISSTTQSPSDESSEADEVRDTDVIKPKGRKKGVWKLVRHQPVDQFETAESQNYESVLNGFNSIVKISPYDKVKTSNVPIQKIEQEIYPQNNDNERFPDIAPEVTTEITTTLASSQSYIKESDNGIKYEDDVQTTTASLSSTTDNLPDSDSFLDTIYSMFGDSGEAAPLSKEESKLPLNPPTFPDEITDAPFSAETPSSTVSDTSQLPDPQETNSSLNVTTTTESNTLRPYEVEPWEMKAIKTSTSTEVSHETEICYKGRCVKSKDFVKRL